MSILDGYEAHIVRHVPEIRYVVNTARDLILEEWSGDITRDILAEHWKKFVADTRVMACRRSLADISGANIRLNGAELGELVAVLVEPALAGRKWITAIIVATDLQYGISRQYGAFAEMYSNESIFRNTPDALAWLETQRHDTTATALR